MFFHTLPVPDLHRRSQPLLDMFDTGANMLPGQRQECETTWNNATEQGNHRESPVVATLLNSKANMGTKWPAWSDIRCAFWSGHYHQKPTRHKPPAHVRQIIGKAIIPAKLKNPWHLSTAKCCSETMRLSWTRMEDNFLAQIQNLSYRPRSPTQFCCHPGQLLRMKPTAPSFHQNGWTPFGIRSCATINPGLDSTFKGWFCCRTLTLLCLLI